MKRRTALLLLVFLLIVSGCGPTPVALVHPQLRTQVVCPTSVGPIRVMSKEDLNAYIGAFKKMTPAERERLRIEQCVSAYEAQGYVRVDLSAPDRRYENSVYGWSISYPGNWPIDTGDVAFIRIYPPSGMPRGLCGVHSARVSYQTVDELTDFLTAYSERSFKEKGLSVAVMGRRQISLQNNISANDVFVEIQPGGKSRRLYVLAGGRGLTIDCEASVQDWDRLAPSFGRIISSFQISN